jgi:hypothetical protein
VEVKRWLSVCQANRQLGFRSWGYEWLTGSRGNYGSTSFAELGFDPVQTLRGKTSEDDRLKLALLPRLEGTVVDYYGPQQAKLDAGQGIKVGFTPLQMVTKDDEGGRASVIVSFGYDEIRGWDAQVLRGE